MSHIRGIGYWSVSQFRQLQHLHQRGFGDRPWQPVHRRSSLRPCVLVIVQVEGEQVLVAQHHDFHLRGPKRHQKASLSVQEHRAIWCQLVVPGDNRLISRIHDGLAAGASPRASPSVHSSSVSSTPTSGRESDAAGMKAARCWASPPAVKRDTATRFCVVRLVPDRCTATRRARTVAVVLAKRATSRSATTTPSTTALA